MIDVLRYIRGHAYDRKQDVVATGGRPQSAYVHKVRLKIFVKTLLGKKKLFDNIEERLAYHFSIEKRSDSAISTRPRTKY